MIVRNKKSGTNILAFQNVRVAIKGGQTANIPALTDFNQIINKADFEKRGWFEIIEEEKKVIEKEIIEESVLEKAKKEVKEYASNK